MRRTTVAFQFRARAELSRNTSDEWILPEIERVVLLASTLLARGSSAG